MQKSSSTSIGSVENFLEEMRSIGLVQELKPWKKFQELMKDIAFKITCIKK